ncbi:hypothetical protein SHIRM173S_01479 [Streptomyces hirsutus]
MTIAPASASLSSVARPAGPPRAGHRDHRTVECPVPHGHRLLRSGANQIAHAAIRSALSAVMPRVEAITFFSFLDSAS